jgi:hypothetical protein
MQANIKLVCIFIGSPGGLGDERKAARDIFEEVNLAHGERWRLHFKIVAWEDTVPGYRRAQSKINEELDRCEYFLGVLHNRWGTPPTNEPDGYSSGFEEEFYRAEKALKSGKMKDMALFFKAMDSQEGYVPGPEIQKVLDFRREQIEGKINYFRDFSTLEEFKSEIRNKLNEIGWAESGLIAIEEGDDASQPEPKQFDNLDGAEESKTGLFDTEARSFISMLLNKPDDWDATHASEAARLRLIAASVSRSGNDEVSLGNHDANLILRHFRDVLLSNREYQTLIDCGVLGFNHSNVPLWRWLSRKEEQEHTPYYRLKILAVVGTEDEKWNSIQVLQSLGERIPTLDNNFDIHRVLKDWFAEGTKDRVFEAAVLFLSENGTMEDLPAIEQALEAAPENRKNKVNGAIVCILSKQSTNDALNRICEHEVDKIDPKKLIELFSNPTSITTDVLTNCLSAKPEYVRLTAVEILFARKEVVVSSANTLLTDSNFDVRLVAVEALRQLNCPINADIIKNALTVEKSTHGLFTFGEKKTDTKVYDIYLRNRMLELSEAELRNATSIPSFLNENELKVLYKKFRSKGAVIAEIRRNLADGFEAYFSSQMKQLETDVGETSKLIAETRKLSKSRRKQLCESALPPLCENLKGEDLTLVRQVLDGFSIRADRDVITYLGRFGDWSDIARINSLADEQSISASLLSFTTTELVDERASVILKLGKLRLADLLDCDLQYSIRNAMLGLISQKSLNDLTNDLLLRELSNKTEQSRIIFALRCVQSLPKARIKNLLDYYLDGDQQRYYNSIHWLDLGASFPSKKAKQIAKCELARR